MTIANYKDGDETHILGLFQLVFGRPMSLDYWNWRFKNNPSGLTLIRLVWDNDLLVGHYAVSPVRMQVNEQTILTALSGTIMTHPDYSGRGIFTELATSTFSYIAKDFNIKVNWAFPNSNSHYGYISKLDWKDIGVLHSMYLPVAKFKQSNTVTVVPFEEFTPKHVLKLEAVTQNFSVKVVRDLPYLNWRYIENPIVDYIMCNVKTADEEGFIILKRFKSQAVPGTVELNIVELGLQDASRLNAILFEITTLIEEPVSSANLWLSLWDKRHLQLEKSGFVPFGKQTFLCADPGEFSAEILDYRNWYYSYGDSDVY